MRAIHQRSEAGGAPAPQSIAVVAPSGHAPLPNAIEFDARWKDTNVARNRYKRAFDLLFATFMLLFLSPLLLLIAAVIYGESGGPVLFKQERTGYRGRVFTILKFRTMTVTEAGAEALQATRDDARITKIGVVLRKLSLDELPQLFNVARGDMSLIGPRPHAVGHDAQFAQFVPGYAERFLAKPGLTGLAQVNGRRGEIRSPDCIRNRVADDCAYVRQWSLWLDLQILARTVPLLFGDANAY